MLPQRHLQIEHGFVRHLHEPHAGSDQSRGARGWGQRGAKQSKHAWKAEKCVTRDARGGGESRLKGWRVVKVEGGRREHLVGEGVAAVLMVHHKKVQGRG